MNKALLTIILALMAVSAHSQHALPNIEAHTITSDILSADRDVLIYLPSGYDVHKDKHYPTLYIMDGQWYFYNGVAIQKTLRGELLLPEMIIVGINMPRPERDSIYSYHWDEFRHFIRNEVVSFVDAKYRTSAERLLFGWESSAALVTSLLFDDGSVFKGAIATNGTYITPEMTDAMARQTQGSKKHLYIANTIKDIYNIDASNQSVAVLTQSNLPDLVWEYRLFDSEIHESLAYVSIYEGLKFYYRNFASLAFSSIDEFNAFGGIPEIRNYFIRRGDQFGLSTDVDSNTKNSLIWLAWRRDNFKAFQLFMTEFSEVLSTRRYASAYWQNRFGQFYLKHKDFDNSIHYFTQGINLYPDDEYMALMYSGLATAYQHKGNMKQARINYKQAVKAAEKNNDPKLELYRSQLNGVK
ncbi:hypothetical protein LVD17_22430 [Fulvivirga ulvae]|uniref:alpha/beta hydrolase-fold protein n=1 Tax=Fulvivirga ulvae TaxID=2904245 RepID=UPI001EEAB042|nr:alpha/beta hydrolase-fold protein [Fulvivirga ulvae]UII31053.1 hypothetical protein LVD17_22430 [Fulvivirga ulvae]